MVGHIVAPRDWCTVVKMPYGEFICNSTADFYMRYVSTSNNPPKRQMPSIIEELDLLSKIMENKNENDNK